eukprot:1298427-Amphidinium_carterae.3
MSALTLNFVLDVFFSCLAWKGNTWALYQKSTDSGGHALVQTPVDNKCASCYKLWETSFSYMTWEDLSTTYSTSSDMKGVIDKARAVMKGEIPKPAGARPSVQTEQTCQVTLEKKYLALNDKDLRKAADLTRLPKVCLKTVPQLEMRTGTGETMETIYLFQHPDPKEQYRVAKVTVNMAASLTEQHMSPESWLWAGQKEKFFLHAMSEQQTQNGAADLLNDKHKLMDLDTFINTKLKKKQDDGSADMEDNDDEDGEEKKEKKKVGVVSVDELVGPAAGGLMSDPVACNVVSSQSIGAGLGVQAKTSPQSLQKLKSSCSLVGSIQDGASAVDSGFGDEDEDDDDDDDGSSPGAWATRRHEQYANFLLLVLPQKSSFYAQGLKQRCAGLDPTWAGVGNVRTSTIMRDLAKKWRKKVPLVKVLDESIDGRSVNGLRKASKRLLQKVSTMAMGTILNTYLEQVSLAQSIVPSVIASVSETQLQKGLQMVKTENIDMPLKCKEALLKRCIDSLLKVNNMRDLLTVINPWATQGTFDPCMPTLGDVYLKGKQTNFNKVLFTDCMHPLLLKGEDGKAEVLALADVSLSLFADMDLLDKSPQEAAGHDDCCTLWRALKALGCPSLLDECQDYLGRQDTSHQTVLAIGGEAWRGSGVPQKAKDIASLRPVWVKWERDQETLICWNSACLCDLAVCACPSEDDVSRLRSSLGQSSKSILSTTMAIIKQAAFWNGLVDEYMSTATNMIKEGPLVKKHLEGLQNLKKNIADVDILSGIVKDMGRLKATLRPGSMDGFIEQFQLAIHDTWELIKSLKPANPDEVHALPAFSKLVGECCLLYPFDAALAQMQQDCGVMLQSVDQATLVQQIVSVVKEFLGVCTGEPKPEIKMVKEKAQKLCEKVKSTALPNEQWNSEELQAELKKVIAYLMEQCVPEIVIKPLSDDYSAFATFSYCLSSVPSVDLQA